MLDGLLEGRDRLEGVVSISPWDHLAEQQLRPRTFDFEHRAEGVAAWKTASRRTGPILASLAVTLGPESAAAMLFEVIGEVTVLETLAVGRAIRDIRRLEKLYGKGRWRKIKGQALVRLPSGRIRKVELHWYEAHGLGRKEIKRKRYLD